MGHCFTQRCGRCHPEQPGKQRNLTRCEELKFEIHHIQYKSSSLLSVASLMIAMSVVFLLHHRIYLAPAISSPRTSPYLGIFTWYMGSLNRHLSGDIPKKTCPTKIIVFLPKRLQSQTSGTARGSVCFLRFLFRWLQYCEAPNGLNIWVWAFWSLLEQVVLQQLVCIVFVQGGLTIIYTKESWSQPNPQCLNPFHRSSTSSSPASIAANTSQAKAMDPRNDHQILLLILDFEWL